LTGLFPAASLDVTGGLATIVGAGIDTFTVPQLPMPVGINLAMRIVGLPDSVQHDLEIGILGPSMESVQDPLKTTFRMTSQPGNPPGWEVQALVPVGLQFQALEDGTYTLNVSVDRASKSSPFRVIIAAAPG
jgi:hypothetical protein